MTGDSAILLSGGLAHSHVPNKVPICTLRILTPDWHIQGPSPVCGSNGKREKPPACDRSRTSQPAGLCICTPAAPPAGPLHDIVAESVSMRGTIRPTHSTLAGIGISAPASLSASGPSSSLPRFLPRRSARLFVGACPCVHFANSVYSNVNAVRCILCAVHCSVYCIYCVQCIVHRR